MSGVEEEEEEGQERRGGRGRANEKKRRGVEETPCQKKESKREIGGREKDYGREI